jgi:hypothetical protein
MRRRASPEAAGGLPGPARNSGDVKDDSLIDEMRAAIRPDRERAPRPREQAADEPAAPVGARPTRLSGGRVETSDGN